VERIAASAAHADSDHGADATMIATLLLAAATVFPAAGTYTYEVETPGGAQYSTTIVITPSADGVTTHEVFGVPVIATTDQRFDSQLHELTFSAQQNGRGALTIAFAHSEATYSIDGKTIRLDLDAPECLLVFDNVLTSVVMLPAVVLATGASDCTYVLSTGVRSEKGYVLDVPPRAHPAQASAADASITMDISGVHETVWYDPKTLIPDFIDFGEEIGDAILVR
jgi:hypothetical protein